MGYGRCVGRVGASAVATRMAVSIGVAARAALATVVPAPTVSPAVRLAASTPPCTGTDVTCALVLGVTSVPTPDQAYLDGRQEPGRRADPSGPENRVHHGDGPRPRLARHGAPPPHLPRDRTPEHLGAWWPGVAGRAVVEIFGALRPHLGSVGSGRGHRPGGGDGRAPQRRSGDLRLLAGRDGREPREAQRSPSSTRRKPKPPISTSCWALISIFPTALLARFPGLYLPIFDFSFNGPRRPTPCSTRLRSSGSTTSGPISRCTR